MNVDLGRFKDGGVKYADSVLLDKISAMERDEKPELSTRDRSHFMDSTLLSRDFSGRSQFKKFGSMSAGLSGSFLDSHKDVVEVWRSLLGGAFPAVIGIMVEVCWSLLGAAFLAVIAGQAFSNYLCQPAASTH
ncbi:XS domain-containing protein [Forsythia ovata]|uniref:XS domain-containing protein n=1 Tax=Forsythia ovata TaxID=205694 RepID=A0ABD1PG56_9LAMI